MTPLEQLNELTRKRNAGELSEEAYIECVKQIGPQHLEPKLQYSGNSWYEVQKRDWRL